MRYFHRFFKQLKLHLPQIYLEYLTKVIDESQISEIYSNSKVKKALLKTVDAFYSKGGFGNNFSPEYIKALNNYKQIVEEETGFKDEFLEQFMHIYRYYSSTSDYECFAENNYDKGLEKDYFDAFTFVATEATENLFNDLKNNNRWWEVDSPSSLRRQFLNNKIVFPDKIMQKLCKKYLGREINIEKELKANQKRNLPPLELVRELDNKMIAQGNLVLNTWTEVRNGKTVVIESKHEPADGVYFTKAYVPRERYYANRENGYDNPRTL